MFIYICLSEYNSCKNNNKNKVNLWKIGVLVRYYLSLSIFTSWMNRSVRRLGIISSVFSRIERKRAFIWCCKRWRKWSESQNKEKQNKRERENALRMLCEYNSVPTHTQSQTTPLGTVLNKLQHTASDIIHTTFSLLPFCVVACSGLEIILQHIY